MHHPLPCCEPHELSLPDAASQVKTRGEADKAREPSLLAARHIVYRMIENVKQSVVARHVRKITDKSKRNHEARRQRSNPERLPPPPPQAKAAAAAALPQEMARQHTGLCPCPRSEKQETMAAPRRTRGPPKQETPRDDNGTTDGTAQEMAAAQQEAAAHEIGSDSIRDSTQRAARCTQRAAR